MTTLAFLEICFILMFVVWLCDTLYATFHFFTTPELAEQNPAFAEAHLKWERSTIPARLFYMAAFMVGYNVRNYRFYATLAAAVIIIIL